MSESLVAKGLRTYADGLGETSAPAADVARRAADTVQAAYEHGVGELLTGVVKVWPNSVESIIGEGIEENRRSDIDQQARDGESLVLSDGTVIHMTPGSRDEIMGPLIAIDVQLEARR